MSRILITGANGLLGSAVAKKFVESGYQVSALCRANSDLSLLSTILPKISIFEGDILDILSLENAFQTTENGTIDYVIHTAAIVSFDPKDRNQMFKVNVEGTANLVNICLKKNIKKLCHVSSIAALGRPIPLPNNEIQEQVIDENQKWEESPLNSNYAKSKYEAELEVWRGEAEGLNVVVVNPSIILGEGDWDKSSTKLFKYVYDEHKFYTTGNVNYVDVKDVVEAIYQLTISDIVGERFILNGGTTTYKHLFEQIAKAFHKNPPSKALSSFLINILWRLEAVRAFLTKKSPLITRETATTAGTKFVYKNQKIIKKLNFSFTNLDTTINRVVQYLENKK